MGFERFVSKRFMPQHGADSGFSGPLSAIAVAGVALGVTVMAMAVGILQGFRNDITQKMVGFGSHITLTSYANTQMYTEESISLDTATLAQLAAHPDVRHLQAYATKGGMVKTDEQIYGIMLRGYGDDYDTTFFARQLVGGSMPHEANEVLVSTTIANKLHLTVGDKMRTYFWQGESYRPRALTVAGLYNTDLSEMDAVYCIGKLSTVQRLNDWDSNQVGGYELLVDNLNRSDEVATQLLPLLPYDIKLTTLREAQPALFAWLDLLGANITLLLVIMAVVSAVCIVSALVAQGIVIGDAVSLILSVVQQRWQVVSLDPENYSMTHVPVVIDPTNYLLISIGAMAVCLLALLLPLAGISHISPAQTMRVEK